MPTRSRSTRRSSARRSGHSQERSSMNGFTRASARLCLAAIASSASAQPAAQPPLVATTRVVYLEVAPAATNRAVGVLRAYRQAVQKSPGVAHVEVVQQIGR